MRPGDRRAGRGPAAAAAPTPSEQAVHIEDRASRLFVLASIAVFTLILLNALLLGKGGLLAAAASPSPVPSVAASASPSPDASPSETASASPAASDESAAPSPSVSPSPS